MILFAGCAVYLTLLLTNYVPPGMDASMHTTGARVIAAQQGLPRTYAPIGPQLFFPAVNLGLPTLATVASRCGAEPCASMLACEQLTFSTFILATYLLLRLWARPTPAALLAVFAVWTTRAQETVGWGGVPTVASLALGLLATRLLLDLVLRPVTGRRSRWESRWSPLPLVHGVSAAGWVYAVAPVALGAALVKTRQRWPACKALLLSGGVTAGVLLAYLIVGHTGISQVDIDWTRDWQAGYAPKGEGWRLLLTIPVYVKTGAGSVAVWGGLVGLVVLLVRRRLGALACVLTSAGVLCLLVANSRAWVLPLSMLLYPECPDLLGHAAVRRGHGPGLASLAGAGPALVVLAAALVVVMLPFAVTRHLHGFQRIAWQPEVSRTQWQALVWARDHLDPRHDFVASCYNTAGSFLPAVAGIPTNAWHIHHFAAEEAEQVLPRPDAHVPVRGAGPAISGLLRGRSGLREPRGGHSAAAQGER